MHVNCHSTSPAKHAEAAAADVHTDVVKVHRRPGGPPRTHELTEHAAETPTDPAQIPGAVDTLVDVGGQSQGTGGTTDPITDPIAQH